MCARKVEEEEDDTVEESLASLGETPRFFGAINLDHKHRFTVTFEGSRSFSAFQEKER